MDFFNKVIFFSIFLLIQLNTLGQVNPFQINKAGQFVYKENAQYNLKYIDVEQGLSSSFIKSMTEDSKGNMWFGTWGGGLMKYDGVTIDIYNIYSGLPSNIVYSVSHCDNKLYFLFQDEGIYTLKNQHFKKIISYSDKLKVVNQFVVDKQLWFITSDSSLYKLESDNRITNQNKVLSIPKTKIFQIFKDKNKVTWLASTSGLIKIKNNKIEILNSKNGYPFDEVNCFHINDKNEMFLSDKKQVYYAKNYNKFLKLNFKNKPLEDVLTILEDKNGHFWFRSYSKGVFRFDGENFLHLNKDNGLINDEIWDIYCDKQNNIWIAPRAGGVYRFDGDYIKHYSVLDGITGRVVWSLAKNKTNQTYYFGTIHGGITEFDGTKFKPFALNDELVNKNIRSLFLDSKQNLWIGTMKGLMSYDVNKKLKSYSQDPKLNHQVIYQIVEDKNKVIWFCKEDGITCMKEGKSFSPFKNNKYNTIYNVCSILFDKEGNKWIASDEGLFCLNKNETKINTSLSDSIKKDAICLFEDSKNRIWIGTRNGIYVKDGKKIFHFTQLNGLSSDIVWSFGEDKYGSIWAGTEFGLSKLDFDGTTFKIKIISNPEGFTGGDCTQNGVLVDEKGLFWWGTSKKLTVLDPSKFIKSHAQPVIQLKNIILNYKNLDLSTDLEFNYKDNNLIFEVSAVDWGFETKLKYQFFLKGYEKKWSPILSENKITYSNLAPGKYVLNARAISNSGLKSKVLRYEFYIKPAFWQTFTFKAIIFLSLILLVFLIFKYRVRALEKNKKELEKIIKERTSEIVSQKEIVEEKNREILDSITYAKRIQSAILPQPKLVKEFLTDSFILYKPKDIVAGDFYWLEVVVDTVLFAAADCTGHGVPGAMVSVVCNNGLNRAVREFGLINPNEILDKTRELVIEEFEKSDEDVKDGMDISLCALDTKTNILKWAGANNPLWIHRNGEILEYKADKQPIGKYSNSKPFNSIEIELQKNDIIYIFTDGYQDQFGGVKQKKFRVSQIRELILTNSEKSMEEQRIIIDVAFENWKGKLDQVDDVCVIGVRM